MYSASYHDIAETQILLTDKLIMKENSTTAGRTSTYKKNVILCI